MQTGIVMPQSEYRAHPGLSSTDIKRMAQSMAHYKYFHDNPENKDTPALQFGRAYHKYCLEKNDFPAYMGFKDDIKISSLGLPEWMKKAYGYDEESEEE